MKYTSAMLCAAALFVAASITAAPARAADQLAEKFGTMPAMWGLQLSPDGSKVSFLRMHESGIPIDVVIDLAKGKTYVAVASKPGKFDVIWCDWANDERLVCALRGVPDVPAGQRKRYAQLLMGVNFDGSKAKTFFDQEMKNTPFFQPPTRVVDWLLDDKNRVLVQMPGDRGQGLDKLNLKNGATLRSEASKVGVNFWLTDGKGVSRVYNERNRDESVWYYRNGADDDWKQLHRSTTEQYETYQPIGFAADGRTLYIIKHQDGRNALFARDLLGDNTEKLVYANPYVGVGQPILLGAAHQVVGFTYRTDVMHHEFLDPDAAKLVAGVQANFPNQEVAIAALSANGKRAIMHVEGVDDPGTYYIMDVDKNAMGKLQVAMPQLADVKMPVTKEYAFKSRDGATIGASLTLPAGKAEKLPTIILAHGSQQPMSYSGFDYLAHYLAAKGFAVMRVYYRGSEDYLRDWAAGANFQNWQRTADDLEDAANALVSAGVTDAAHVCVAGWGTGGYAALMAGAQHRGLFKCVAAVAPITNPIRLIGLVRQAFSGKDSESYLPLDSNTLVRSSPENRVNDLTQPVLVIQGEDDVFVDYNQTQDFGSKLKAVNASADFVYVEKADGTFARSKFRVDMLTRIGRFLDKNIGK